MKTVVDGGVFNLEAEALLNGAQSRELVPSFGGAKVALSARHDGTFLDFCWSGESRPPDSISLNADGVVAMLRAVSKAFPRTVRHVMQPIEAATAPVVSRRANYVTGVVRMRGTKAQWPTSKFMDLVTPADWDAERVFDLVRSGAYLLAAANSRHPLLLVGLDRATPVLHQHGLVEWEGHLGLARRADGAAPTLQVRGTYVLSQAMPADEIKSRIMTAHPRLLAVSSVQVLREAQTR